MSGAATHTSWPRSQLPGYSPTRTRSVLQTENTTGRRCWQKFHDRDRWFNFRALTRCRRGTAERNAGRPKQTSSFGELMATLALTRENSTPAKAVAAAPAARFRIESVDFLRGVVMILMALDHTRDFLGVNTTSPTDLGHTTIPLFFTRWITHFCAPVFFLLTGTGAYLAGRRRPPRELAWFLVTRGVWLLVLDALVLRSFAFQFNVDYRVTVLNVLWAIGWTMIVLAALVRLRPAVVLAFGAVMIAT